MRIDAPDQQRARGVSLVEVAVSMVVLAIMSLVIVQTIRSLSQADTSIRDDSKARSLADRVIEHIESDVSCTARMFAEGDLARAYLARCDVVGLLGQGGAVLTGSKLPVPSPLGTFEPDTPTTAFTGNLLLLGRRDGVVTVDLGAVGGGMRRVDTLRLVAWFLHPGPVTGIDLSRWTSARIARSTDLDATSEPTQRAALLQGLVGLGIRYVWDLSERADASLQVINGDGSLRPMTTSETLAFDPQLSAPRIMGKRNLGIAKNRSLTTPVPRFAIATSNFPHGFELKRDGDGSGDLLLIRLVIASTSQSRRAVFAEATRQVSFRSE